MRTALVVLGLLVQASPRPDAGHRLLEARRLQDLALYDRAEEILRGFLKAAPADSQLQRSIPDFRIALCDVLLAARKYDELGIEAEALRMNPRHRRHGLSFLAAGAWHAGRIEDAARFVEEAAKAPADTGSAEPDRRLRLIRGVMGWKRLETPTHVVHYPPDSSIASDPSAFGKRLDVAFDRIRSELDLEFPGKVEAFFFNDQAQADAVLERTLGSADAAMRTYVARPDGPPGFGIAQVLSFFVANRRERRPPALPGFREGFHAAHADDPRWDRRRDEVPRRLAAGGRLPPLVEILIRPASDAEGFAVRASFVRWLIRTRGRDLFRKFWAEYNDLSGVDVPDLRKPWVEIYGVAPEDLEAAWRSSIR